MRTPGRSALVPRHRRTPPCPLPADIALQRPGDHIPQRRRAGRKIPGEESSHGFTLRSKRENDRQNPRISHGKHDARG